MSLRSLSFLLLVSASAFSLSADPVGVWKGRIEVKFPPIPANAAPQQKAAMLKAKAQIAKGSIKLTFKKNKTYAAHATGLPMLGDPDNNGTWTQKGNTIVMTGAKEKTPQNFTLSKNGKMLTFPLPGGQGRIVFVR